jgi:superfamily II DNA helicase RecQ
MIEIPCLYLLLLLAALMQDQVASLRRRGISADFLSSSQSESERGRVYGQLESLAGSRGREGAGGGGGGLQMLYVTPELIATYRSGWVNSARGHRTACGSCLLA